MPILISSHLVNTYFPDLLFTSQPYNTMELVHIGYLKPSVFILNLFLFNLSIWVFCRVFVDVCGG